MIKKLLITISVISICHAYVASAADLKIYSSAEQLGEIPFDDQFDANGNLTKESKGFEKNWAGKTIAIRGKLNQAGNLLVDENFVVGCKDVLKGIKLSTIVTVSGKLKSRSVGGSGGQPIQLSECKFVK